MKKIIIFCFSLFLAIGLSLPAKAQEILNFNNKPENKIIVYFFYGDGCPHCAKESKFLSKLQNNYPTVNIKAYEVWNNQENADLMKKVGEKLGIKITGIPLTIVGDKSISGYYNDKTTGLNITNAIDYSLNNGCQDIVESILNNNVNQELKDCEHGCDKNNQECLHDCGCSADTVSESKINPKLNLPFIGEINTKNISLPLLTIVIGALDGFNPCAMWTLLFLLSLLLGMENRLKMWVLGGAFILTSGFVYYLFMAAWLNLFLFIGFIFWLRLIIGGVALASGAYHVNEFIKNPKGLCHVTQDEKRKKFFYRLKDIINNNNNFWLVLGGIIILAGAVNLVELVCSAGFPAIYTQILSMASLPKWQYYLYLLFYIIMFMLEQLIVFFIAMFTLKMKVISSKYTRWSTLVGGILMLIIGVLLIFKPGWIMFG